MKTENFELKVGIFVVVALVALTVLVAKAGDFYWKPGYDVRFLFDFVSGIETGAPVRLAGVNVGKITATNIVRSQDGRTQIELMARINREVVIDEDSQVRISSLGLLGEKYVEINPGQSGKPAIDKNGLLVGSRSSVVSDLAESGSRLIAKMEDAIDHVNQVVSDPDFKKAAKGTFVNADSTFGNASVVAKNFVQVSEDLKDAAASAKIVLARLKNGEGTVGKLLTEDKIAKNLEAFSEDIKAHPWKLLKRY